MPYIQYKCPNCGNTSFEIFDKFDWVGYDCSSTGYEGDRPIVRCSKCHYDTEWSIEVEPDPECTLEAVDQIHLAYREEINIR